MVCKMQVKLVLLVICAYAFLILSLANSAAQLGLMLKIDFVQNATNLTETILFNLVQTIIQGIHVIEYFILIYSFSTFLCNGDKQQLADQVRDFKPDTCTAKVKTIVLIVLLTLYFALVLASPSLYILSWRNLQHTELYIYYTVLQFITHITNGLTRVAMVTVTMLVRNAWKKGQHDLLNLIVNELRQTFNDISANYKNTGDFVSPFQGIFQRWFVLQWITYFVATTVTFALLFDTLIENHITFDLQTLNVFAYLAYYISALAIPYGCGILMNSYHGKYSEQLEQKQKDLLSQTQNDGIWIMQSSALIPINPQYMFIPSLCGLRIPLNSTGHSLTIVLTLLAFTLGLISKWANTID